MPDGILEVKRVPTTVVCRTFTIVFALAICAISYWLWRVPLHWYVIKLDDFDYLDRSRNAAALSRHLFTPHYGHVGAAVPPRDLLPFQARRIAPGVALRTGLGVVSNARSCHPLIRARRRT